MRKRALLFLAVLFVVQAVIGCGSGNGSSNPTGLSVAVSPQNATLSSGGAQTFAAAVSNPTSSDTAVTWTATGGTISSDGTFTAGSLSGDFVIVATSHADPTKVSSTTVHISSSQTIVSVAIRPANVSLAPNATQSFSATVSGSPNTGVTWSVQESAGGSITTAGLYTAPATTGTFHVIATSQADPSKKAVATVVVSATPTVIVAIDPSSVYLVTGGARAFTATVSGAQNTAVTWSVQEAGGGTVDANGSYTAPGTPGTFHVVATSQADATKSATATVNVSSATPPSSIGPTTILFSSDLEGTQLANGLKQSNIYRIESDGTNRIRLTNNEGNSFNAVPSADGTKIVFTSNRAGGGFDDVYVMNADGSSVTRLTSTAGHSNYDARFSPDGTKIVFVSDRDGNIEIYTMNADGTNQTRMTNNGATDFDPSYSPDGNTIVFASNRNDGNLEIYTMDAHTPNGPVTRLTKSAGIDRNPEYRPDGANIVFESERDGNLEIYIMKADGSGQTNLTKNVASDQEPFFTANGTKIVFSSGRGSVNNNNQIFIMNADGSNQTVLTNNPANSAFPSSR